MFVEDKFKITLQHYSYFNAQQLVHSRTYLVVMGSAAWFGPHRPSRPLPTMPVLPIGFLGQPGKKGKHIRYIYTWQAFGFPNGVIYIR